MNHLFTELFTITVLSYWACCAAFRFGFWFGWLTDPEQWPRVMATLLLDLFRWDRQMSRAINDLDACAEAMTAGMGRAPRGTPEGAPK